MTDNSPPQLQEAPQEGREGSEPGFSSEGLKELRHQLNLSVEQFAVKIGRSAQTIRRWEAKGGVPKREIPRVIELRDRERNIAPLPSSSIKEHKNLLEAENHRLGTRTRNYILDCPSRCDRFWVFKSFVPFLSGYDLEIRKSFLRQARTGTAFFFLFWPPTNKYEPKIIYESERSFGLLKRAVAQSSSEEPMGSDLFRLIRGFRITSHYYQTLLGLSATFTSTVIAEYKKEEIKKTGRRHDIFVEMPVATYEKQPDEKGAEPRRRSEGEVLWLELPHDHAQTLMDLWQPTLEILRGDLASSDCSFAEEVLDDIEKALRYEKRDALSKPVLENPMSEQQ